MPTPKQEKTWEVRIAAAAKEYRECRRIVARNRCLSDATKDQVQSLMSAAFEVAELYAGEIGDVEEGS